MRTIPPAITWNGPILIIGFGSIGRAILPLIDRHIQFDRSLLTVIDPSDSNKAIAQEYRADFLNFPITRENFKARLQKIVERSSHQSLIINVSTNVGSKEIIQFAHSTNSLYIDTSIDPWPGLFFDKTASPVEKSNYALRESLLELKAQCLGGPTAISCCGANPGAVSWFVKQALLDLARDRNETIKVPETREDWSRLMMRLGVRGIQISERDTQKSKHPRADGSFINTWSAEGCLSEALQPAELGWGTNENSFPRGAREHDFGCRAAIYLEMFGGETKVKTWTPSYGAHWGFLISHSETISIADYYTITESEKVLYRPSCHYAYRPTDITVEALSELFLNNGTPQQTMGVLTEEDIDGGYDELGVLLYGHGDKAYWYGSTLSIDDTRNLIPYQNATGLQVASAVLAGIAWAINHPRAGLVEADEIDFQECLAIQRPYLGKLGGHYTDWKPLNGAQHRAFSGSDSWQFTNIIL